MFDVARISSTAAISWRSESFKNSVVSKYKTVKCAGTIAGDNTLSKEPLLVRFQIFCHTSIACCTGRVGSSSIEMLLERYVRAVERIR